MLYIYTDFIYTFTYHTPTLIWLVVNHDNTWTFIIAF